MEEEAKREGKEEIQNSEIMAGGRDIRSQTKERKGREEEAR